MSVLVIGPEEQDAIDAACKTAEQHPTELTPEMLKAIEPLAGKFKVELSDRPPNWHTMVKDAQTVWLPTGYKCNISFEQQPAGLCRHLSVSVPTPGKLPNEHAVKMIADAFGITMDIEKKPFKLWLEEFDPGHHAVNVVEPVTWPRN